jgi:sterol O-acyltransferase
MLLRQWPWVQSGFLTLHSLVCTWKLAKMDIFTDARLPAQVMIMKMHSYMTINGYLQFVSTRSQRVVEELRRATEDVGGWDAALATAKAHREELDAANASGITGSESEFTPSITPVEHTSGVTSSYASVATANALRQRLMDVSANSRVSTPSIEMPQFPVSTDTKIAQNGSVIPTVSPPSPHPLVDHPVERISALATDYTDMENELTSSGPKYVRWPNNITYKDFSVYQLIPTLVYELEYPRTDRCVPLLRSIVRLLMAPVL